MPVIVRPEKNTEAPQALSGHMPVIVRPDQTDLLDKHRSTTEREKISISFSILNKWQVFFDSHTSRTTSSEENSAFVKGGEQDTPAQEHHCGKHRK